MLQGLRGRKLTSRVFRASAVLAVTFLAAVLVPDGQVMGQESGRPGRLGPGGSGRLPEVRRADATLEINLEDYLLGISARGGLELDREALSASIQELLGTSQPLETVLLSDLLDAAPRIRISWRGMSSELGGKTIIFLARRVVGRDLPIREITVGHMLDALPDVTLSSDGTPSVAGQPGLLSDLGRTLRKAERFDRARDPEFLERRGLEMEYAQVKVMVKKLRRDGIGQGDEELLYDEAFGRLFDADRADAVPLLEGHRLLEVELEEADMRGMTHPERIAFRWEARRRAFGDEVAAALFGRKETVERYQYDLLEIEADESLDEGQRAALIEERQTQLKVEMAQQGSYVGFVGQDRGQVDAELRVRYGDRFDSLSDEELREARRRVYLERLPAASRKDVEQLRGRTQR